MNETSWLPGLMVALAGLIAGALFVSFGRRQRKGQPASDSPAAELELRYRQLVGQLKELHAERHLWGEEKFQAERERLELAAAAALREKDPKLKTKGQVAKAAAKPEGAPERRGGVKTALALGGLVVLFALVGLMLGQESQPRAEEPKAPLTEEEPELDPHLAAAFERLQADPENLQALSQLAHQLIHRGQVGAAQGYVERAVAIDPFHLESRIHRAVVTAASGKRAEGLKQLEHLADTYPGAQEARLFASAIARELGDPRRALEQLERFAQEAPPQEQPPMLQQALEQLRAAATK